MPDYYYNIDSKKTPLTRKEGLFTVGREHFSFVQELDDFLQKAGYSVQRISSRPDYGDLLLVSSPLRKVSAEGIRNDMHREMSIKARFVTQVYENSGRLPALLLLDDQIEVPGELKTPAEKGEFENTYGVNVYTESDRKKLFWLRVHQPDGEHIMEVANKIYEEHKLLARAKMHIVPIRS